MSRKILLIGPTGQVGWELLRCTQSLGDVLAVSRSQCHQAHTHLDLSDLDAIRKIIQDIKPAIILNAAAYTAVDKAEEEDAQVYHINGTVPGILAEEAKKVGAILVHYSTDYVFNGENIVPYKETDPVSPIGIYGNSKLEGEKAIQAVGGSYLIFRTAWVYGNRGRNFLLTMQRLAQERDLLKIVSDQVGTPTWSRMIAEATAQVLTQLHSPLYQADTKTLSGIYHLTCAGQTSWYEFAKAIIAHMPHSPQILPIATADYPTPAKRPAYSVLSNEKLAQTFGINLPSWDKALALCLFENKIQN